MKTTCCSGARIWALAATFAGSVHAAPLLYEVSFKGETVATQTVTIVQANGRTTVSTSFEAELPVFVARHRYAEHLSATFRADGGVERIAAVRRDGPLQTTVAGSLAPDGRLQLVRTDINGVATNFLARADYDFHSLILYGTAPAGFLPTNSVARVLQVAEGAVQPVAIQSITESDTFERQHLVSRHLIWSAGTLTSHSWHPERFSNLPRRYIRQTDNGEFIFTLIR